MVEKMRWSPSMSVVGIAVLILSGGASETHQNRGDPDRRSFPLLDGIIDRVGERTGRVFVGFDRLVQELSKQTGSSKMAKISGVDGCGQLYDSRYVWKNDAHAARRPRACEF